MSGAAFLSTKTSTRPEPICLSWLLSTEKHHHHRDPELRLRLRRTPRNQRGFAFINVSGNVSAESVTPYIYTLEASRIHLTEGE